MGAKVFTQGDYVRIKGVSPALLDPILVPTLSEGIQLRNQIRDLAHLCQHSILEFLLDLGILIMQVLFSNKGQGWIS